jgi:DNA repair protein RecO (recombination protein O)
VAAEESTPAIVLRTRDYSESDRIVTLLTRDAGKLSGIAKGAKISRRRFERKLEVFSHVMLYFRRRPHGELVFITRAESAALPPHELSDDLGKIARGSYMIELADALTREEAEASAAYRILAEALLALSRNGAGVSLRQAFELRMLAWAGYELEFARCRACSREPAESGSFGFVPSRGGIICSDCRRKIPVIAMALSHTSAAALARLGTMPIAETAAADAAGSDGKLAIARFIAGVIDRKLRSVEFLESVL